MFDPKFFEELNAKIADLIKASPAKDIEKNVKAMMMSMFAKLDLVTREEFDVQRKVLEKTREKLDAIEAQLTRMAPAAAPPPASAGGSSESDPGA